MSELSCIVEGDRGENPGIMGAGSPREVGEERAGGRIPMGAGEKLE